MAPEVCGVGVAVEEDQDRVWGRGKRVVARYAGGGDVFCEV